MRTFTALMSSSARSITLITPAAGLALRAAIDATFFVAFFAVDRGALLTVFLLAGFLAATGADRVVFARFSAMHTSS